MIQCICRAKFGAWHTESAQYGECSENKGKDDGGSAGVDSAPRTGSDWERVKAPLGS